MEKPTLKQTHEGLFTSSSLCPSIPDSAEQGLRPRGEFLLRFKGLSRGPPEGLEQFLKFCVHFDMGPSRALSSVLILIGASCPWPGLSFDSIVGLSRTLSCKQKRFHTWKGDVTLSLYAEDAVLETGNLGASTKTC